MSGEDEDADGLLAEQLRYYRRRAGEYDEMYERDDEPEVAAALAELDRFVAGLAGGGIVVELACGTGRWTPLLLGDRVSRLLAVDAAPEMLAAHAQAVPDRRVERIRADIFDWQPPEPADLAFFGFWLSHVPVERLADFWDSVADMLAPRGHVAFIDSGVGAASVEEWHSVQAGTPVATRTLSDGGRYRVVKVIRPAQQLAADLRARGWDADVREVGDFVAGVATRP